MLNVNELIGFGVGEGLAPLVCTYITTWTTNNNSTTYNPSAVSIGSESADRYVVIVPMGSGDTNNEILSATMDGVSMDHVVGNLGFTGNDAAGIFILEKPTGTTANFSFTFAGGKGRAAMSVFTITGPLQSKVPVSSKYSSADGYSVSMLTKDGGCVIAGIANQGNTSQTWSGVTEDYDATQESSASSFSSAHKNVQAGQTETISVTPSDGNGYAVFASFR